MKKKKFNIKKINYKHNYEFLSEVKTNTLAPGLNKQTILLISRKKKEHKFLLLWRLTAYKYWLTLLEPSWSALQYKKINYSNIIYYSSPNSTENYKLIFDTYKKLNIKLNTNEKNIAIDAIFDSVSLTTTFQDQLYNLGIIFSSFSNAIKNHYTLIKKYIGYIVTSTDNYYSALNSAVFSDGSFCYIPKKVYCPIELSTYFRINTVLIGQFERTLIIADNDSYVSYLEGCTAPIRDTNQLHAAVVEIIALKKAVVKYSTIQNWYSGNKKGIGGIFNFVTKRGLCLGDFAKISWIQIEVGSARTWKYPSIILKGFKTIGEFYSVAFTSNYQQTDTGTKILHIGKKSNSIIFSKSILSGFSKNIFRSLIKTTEQATHTTVYSQCDSLLLSNNSVSQTYPEFQIIGNTNTIVHEAFAGKLDYDKIFYCLQRGLTVKNSTVLIINGFCNEALNKLPTEFSIEIYKLIEKHYEDFLKC